MAPIPLVDLKAQYRAIKPAIDQAIQRVLASGQFVLGPEVAALEREFTAFCRTRYAVGVASGTDALELSLRACGIKPGDEVLTTGYSFIAAAEAILAVGAIPKFVDIDPVNYALDPAALAARVTRRTTAIIPVHLFGHPCDLDAVGRVARRHKLAVIEDCAQAVGATFRGRPVGSFGDAAAFSFYPSKNLGGYGDGGIVVTNRPKLAEWVRLLRAHGSRVQYRHDLLGRNSRLDELQAAVLRVKLRRLRRWNEARRRLAHRYREAFRRQGLYQVVLPQERPRCAHVYHLFCIRTPRRDRVRAALARQGIATQVAYPATLPQQPALRSIVSRADRCPVAERVSREILALPMYPELTASQIARIVRAVSLALF
jgi:dTDP-4-amino-4,6-dideoxygalactose transaminase